MLHLTLRWNNWKNFETIFSSRMVPADIPQQEKATWPILTANKLL